MRESTSGAMERTPNLRQLTAAQRFAYRQLRDRILLRNFSGQPLKSLLLTSARSGEGTSTTIAYLALTFAENPNCRGVLIVDACLSRPQQHRLFNVNQRPGLAEFLEEACAASEVVKFSSCQHIHVMPAGDVPTELLARRARFHEWLKTAYAEFDVVLIDTPSVAEATASESLASIVDGIVLVVRANASPRNVLEEALQRLQVAGGNVVGMAMQDYVEYVPAFLRRRLSV